MSTRYKADLIDGGRRFLENAPSEPKNVPAPGLVGWKNPLDFVCVKCAGRIIERGCNIALLSADPVWADQYDGRRCDLCADQYVWFKGKVWRYGGLKDAHNRVNITDVKDPSTGNSARAEELRFCDEDTMKAIEYFIQKEG